MWALPTSSPAWTEGFVPLLQQAVEVDVIDSDGAVCFALHGDDLLHVDR